MHGILPVLDLVANKYLENGKIMLITDRVYSRVQKEDWQGRCQNSGRHAQERIHNIMSRTLIAEHEQQGSGELSAQHGTPQDRF